MRVAELASGRSGDKGNIANVAIVANDPASYARLKEKLTVNRVAEELGTLVTGSIERHELDNLGVLNFVLHGALDGGATRSLRFDALGKSLADRVLQIEL